MDKINLLYSEVLPIMMGFFAGYTFCFYRNGVERQLSTLLVLHTLVTKRIRLILSLAEDDLVQLVSYQVLLEHISSVLYKKKVNVEIFNIFKERIAENEFCHLIDYIQNVNTVVQQEIRKAYFFADPKRLIKKIENFK